MAPKKNLPAAEEKKEEQAEDTKKRKAEEKKDEPAKKEAKKEESKKEEPKEEEAGEKEKDAPADRRGLVKETAGFEADSVTLNVVPTLGGKVLMALSDGGMQYLIAGARANLGMKGGRYMFEVKIVEALNPSEATVPAGRRVPMPRQLVRLGFSLAKSELILGESPEGVCFDSEGHFTADGKKSAVSQRFTRDQVLAVLLNLEKSGPNSNTISLFRDGERISEPQPLPEGLRGKTLFPHVAFRNVSVQVHFGPQPLSALPFNCRTLQGAAADDVVYAPSPAPKDGKYEVLMPVAFPDEGTFDWIDSFLAKNPHYVELSDRKIYEWALKSGFWKANKTGKDSNDRPEFNFGVPSMDDVSARRVINSIAGVVPRHYLVAEVKGNLISSERAETLKRFSPTHYKRVAHVVMGEPSSEYKAMQHEKMLKDKQDKLDVEFKAKKAEKERKKQMELRQKQLMDMRKKAEESRKKAAEEAKKKAEEAKKKAEEEKKKEAGEGETKEEDAEMADASKEAEETKAKEESKEETKEEEVKEEEVKQEEAEEEKKDEEMEEEETEPPKAELSDEEKKLWFRAKATPDLTPVVLNQSFGQFTVPEKSEGFTEIKYEWQNAAKSKEYLRKWVVERKQTSRIEDLQPSKWFVDKYAEWQKSSKEWVAKQKTFKANAPKKEKKEEKKEGEEGDAEAAGAEDERVEGDIFTVEDICDVGNGEPLFAHFGMEDWALLALRYELFLLVHAFKKDVDDQDIPGVLEQHLAFYYNKYYNKQLNPKYFGVASNAELVELVKDTVTIPSESQVLSSELSDDADAVDIFVKLTEESRRERQRRIDAGDETAKLKFSPMALQQPATAKVTVSAAGAGASPAGAVAAGLRPGSWQARPQATFPRGPMAAARWPAAQAYASRQPFAQKWR